MKKLVSVDDYREAWRLQDAGDGWIVYRKDADYSCSADTIGVDGDLIDGGIGGMSDTERRLCGFLFATQPGGTKADLSDLYEHAERTGIRVEEGPTDVQLDPVTKEMLAHEPYLLKDPKTGELWENLKKKARLQHAMLVYSLHRQEWAAKWVKMTNRILLELDKQGLELARLGILKRIDPIRIERAREYKASAARVPKRLRATLRQLSQVASEELPVSSTSHAVLERQFTEYGSFLDEYKQRRESRFETIAEHHFQTMAGPYKHLLLDPRGRPSLKNLAGRVAKTVFVQLADELIDIHGVSLRKSTRLAHQISCLLFPNERLTGKTNPFVQTFAKNALNEYKYAKKSLPSV